MATDKKGITVKIDAGLHAEIREYLAAHEMTMADFISLAVEDELHPKHQEREEITMEKMRTLAFQVPEDLFQKIKDYLHRNNMTQKEFVIGLIENEIERDLTAREDQENVAKIDESEEAETLEDEDTVYEDINDAADEAEEDDLEETGDASEGEYLDEDGEALDETDEDSEYIEDDDFDEDSELSADDDLDEESETEENDEDEGMCMSM